MALQGSIMEPNTRDSAAVNKSGLALNTEVKVINLPTEK